MTEGGIGRAGAGLLGLVSMIVLLHRLHHPALGPSVTDVGGWTTWAAAAGPVGVAMGVVRVAALALSWYLLVVSIVAILARATRSGPFVTLAAAVTTAHTRDLVLVVVGTGVLATLPMEVRAPATVEVGVDGPVAAGPAATHGGPAAATHPNLDEPGTAGAQASHRPGRVGSAATAVHLRRLPAAAPSMAADVRMVRLDATVTDATDDGHGPRMHRLDNNPVGDQDTGAGDREHDRFTVAPGDHFWRIAEAEVASRRGPDPAERHVHRYWLRLVEANRDVLVDPDNADLLLPGQVLRLPPLDDGDAA